MKFICGLLIWVQKYQNKSESNFLIQLMTQFNMFLLFKTKNYWKRETSTDTEQKW